jgi:pyruvate,orthophosphate dikinase
MLATAAAARHRLPEITETQARAISSRRRRVRQKGKAKPEVMIPLAGFKHELDLQVDRPRVAKEVKERR